MARLFLLAALAFVCLAQCNANATAYRNAVFTAINRARLNNGLKALRPVAVLNTNARNWASKLIQMNAAYVDRNLYVNGKRMWQIVARMSNRNLRAEELVNIWLKGATRPFVLRSDVTTMGFGMANNWSQTNWRYVAEFQ